MKKGQVVKDQATGKKFAMGATGIKGLVERVTTYAQGQGGEVLLQPTKAPLGQAFTMKCTKCGAKFHIDASNKAERYDEFQESCISHARACGMGAAIIPIR